MHAATITAQWKFNDPGNPTTSVASTGGYVGTFNGVAARTASGGGVSGVAGDYALDINGTTGAMISSTPAFLTALNAVTGTQAISITYWQFVDTTPNSFALWATSPSSNSGFRGLSAHSPWSDGNVYFDTSGCCGPTQRISGVLGQTLGTWQLMSLVYDNGTKTAYRDTTVVASGTGGAALMTDINAFIMANDPGLVTGMDAKIDNFTIWNGGLVRGECGGPRREASARAHRRSARNDRPHRCLDVSSAGKRLKARAARPWSGGVSQATRRGAMGHSEVTHTLAADPAAGTDAAEDSRTTLTESGAAVLSRVGSGQCPNPPHRRPTTQLERAAEPSHIGPWPLNLRLSLQKSRSGPIDPPFFFVVFPLLLVAAYLIEDWRGARAWDKATARLAAEGETLDLASLWPPPVPPEENFCTTPALDGIAEVIDGDVTKGEPARKRERLRALDITHLTPSGGPLLKRGGLDWAAWRKYLARQSSLPVPPDEPDPATAVFVGLDTHRAPFDEAGRRASRSVGIGKDVDDHCQDAPTRLVPSKPGCFGEVASRSLHRSATCRVAAGIRAPPAQLELEASRKRKAVNPYTFLAAWVPYYSSSSLSLAFSEIDSRQLLISCALERFYLKNQRYPETLPVLRPNFCRIFRSISTESRSRYARDESNGRYRLWSVGLNLIDDWHGQPPLETPPARGTSKPGPRDALDWVLSFPAAR